MRSIWRSWAICALTLWGCSSASTDSVTGTGSLSEEGEGTFSPGDAGREDSAPASPDRDAEAPSAASDAGTVDAADASSPTPPPATEELAYADCVFEAVNAFRSNQGLKVAYVRDGKLDQVGATYAEYMSDRGLFAHSADGQSFGDRLDAAGVAWASAAENLQKNGFSSVTSACAETVNGQGGWASSTQGHREAMLGQDANGTDKGFTHAGVGVARDGSGQWRVAMYFVRY